VKAFDDVYRGRKVFITGHTGFKGSWLALWLLELGAEVAGYSDGIPTVPSNFDLLGLEGRIRHYTADIRSIQTLEDALDDFRPDVVFHLAAQALVQRSYADPLNTYSTNMMGMVNVLEAVRKRTWIDTVVLISSDKVYRNEEWCWGYRENDKLGGHDPYSASKSAADLVAQSYMHSYFRESPTGLAITRAGNVIGGGDWATDRIVPDCIRAWVEGRKVAIRSPEATRPWQHVLEPLSGYLALGAGLLQKRDGLRGEAFNFGPDARVNQTVHELLKAMTKRWQGTHWEVPEGFEGRGHEAQLLKLSCDKALSYLSWSATMDFSETVNFTVDWYRNWHEGQIPVSDFTIGQIETYCKAAATLNLSWVHA
jgi:CDP-glucose 4,6-dehydratase